MHFFYFFIVQWSDVDDGDTRTVYVDLFIVFLFIFIEVYICPFFWDCYHLFLLFKHIWWFGVEEDKKKWVVHCFGDFLTSYAVGDYVYDQLLFIMLQYYGSH